jgi:hypothetical protein
VRLASAVPEAAQLEREWPSEPGMIPDWSRDKPRGLVECTPVAGARPSGRFVDFGAVHIVTTAALQQAGADARRFRPNLVLELPFEPEPGDVIRIGSELTVRVQMPTPRCAVPGAAQPGLEAAPELLRALGRNRVQVGDLGRAACFGWYGQVLKPGFVRMRDSARFENR